MQADYDLVGHDTYPFAAYDKSDRRQISDDYVEVFKFVPKGGSGTATASRPGQGETVKRRAGTAQAEYRVPSTEYRVPSTEYRVLSTEY